MRSIDQIIGFVNNGFRVKILVSDYEIVDLKQLAASLNSENATLVQLVLLNCSLIELRRTSEIFANCDVYFEVIPKSSISSSELAELKGIAKNVRFDLSINFEEN